VEDFPDKIMIL